MGTVRAERAGTLRHEEVRAFIAALYEGELHTKRVTALAGARLGVMASASLAVAVIGQALAQARGLVTKHAVKQVDRLLSNAGIDVWDSFACWVPRQIGARRNSRIAAAVAELLELAPHPRAGEARVSGRALAQVGGERVQPSWAWLARAVGGRFEAVGDVFAHRLAIDAELARDGRDGEPLSVEVQDHHKLPQVDHRRRSPSEPEPRPSATKLSVRSPGEF